MSIASSDVRAGDQVFRVYESGKPPAETVLFLHGSGPGATGMANWSQIIDDLSGQFHCLAPDMIGFGDSTHPDPAPRGMSPFNELRSDALIALLDALGIDRVNLVGNSMGGSLALLLAEKVPDRVGRIVLLGCGGAPNRAVSPGLAHLRTFNADPTEESLRELLTQFVYDLAPIADRIDQIISERMAYVRRADVQRSHVATFDPAGPRRFFQPEELASISHEVLTVHGRDDRIIPVSSSRYFAEHLPNASHYEIAQCGHWTQIEHPQLFELLVTRFFAGQL